MVAFMLFSFQIEVLNSTNNVLSTFSRLTADSTAKADHPQMFMLCVAQALQILEVYAVKSKNFMILADGIRSLNLVDWLLAE